MIQKVQVNIISYFQSFCNYQNRLNLILLLNLENFKGSVGPFDVVAAVLDRDPIVVVNLPLA